VTIIEVLAPSIEIDCGLSADPPSPANPMTCDNATVE